MMQQDQNNTGPEAGKNIPKTPISEEPVSTHVDNAHAAGLGAMGRNDEKLPTGADGAEDLMPETPAY